MMAKACASVLGFLALVALTAPGPVDEAPTRSRRFEFTYHFVVENIPPQAKVVRVWIPLATSDANQDIAVKKISSPVPVRREREAEYGDRMLYAEIHGPKAPAAEFTLDYEVTRREYNKGSYASLLRFNTAPPDAPIRLARFVEPDRLVPTGGRMRELAEEITGNRQGPIEKAYALYDYVFRTLRYDKSGTGWGRGDAIWACDAKRGNCTDFHSLFIALARAEDIPARFEIGFPLPASTHEGEIPGYHCWAEFYAQGAGWVPVDISEAWKNQAKHDYFFGALDVNRLQFSLGRDLTLSPPQSGPPLNYFIYPYAEVDGQPYTDINKRFSFRDLTSTAARGPSGSK